MSSPQLPVALISPTIAAVNLPFLGSRQSPHAPFQYLLHAVDRLGAIIGIPSWVVRREHLRAGDIVDLHFPFRTDDGWHRHHAVIESVRWEAEQSEQVCVTTFRDRHPLHHPVHASLETGVIAFRTEGGEAADPAELMRGLVRDCLLQKQGVAVYFKHLVPLFSRITEFPTEDFGVLRGMVLEDIRKRIATNIASFERWWQQAASGALTPANLSLEIDLEDLRAAVEGEIDNELFEATFSTPAIRPYMNAIRLLEDKLYMNYNTLVLLYAHAL